MISLKLSWLTVLAACTVALINIYPIYEWDFKCRGICIIHGHN